uniref:Uncharacterized protein n=1 Tax=Tetranychus urticae TaxID=32264 RepID=T1K9Y3_TETUR
MSAAPLPQTLCLLVFMESFGLNYKDIIKKMEYFDKFYFNYYS